ncbi:cell wall-binding repeat-containing protein [Clostridium botulinum]|uniref:N-acetylmuramoyl-L-alanine amidase n=1 Tax=Clostridium botulinum (strain 657 / Type Ba4) TaxID=515621 RepID=A0A3F2ZVK3_CLOB6|nr:cell wall-binding repeat-containing protein [Clostridium botulinum]AJD26482.1 cell wall binding repeat 2 family protein [Clostridium botulinum CDC_297]ACQ52168.1 putative N-acetylmuramoyl-L-alanine amidase [Clostridium botulinum Ba4 str. 657]APQ99748.1 cell wall binding repeat 2 family protein [Clostridium botulinum]APU59360.1 cell wall binding repeat 2 family protein [Clostridium botulinum]AUN02097.1 N-acetylmuramoyl-L-alanine amidase [Clostridium botulinum]
MKKRLLNITSAVVASCVMFFSSNVVSAATLQERLCGNNRYETNSKIVDSGWTSSEYAVVASGEDFADALCASPLAQQNKAPILLTNKDNLSIENKKQLSRLKVKKVFIVGGTGVITDNVKLEIESMGIETSRIYGENRFETSIQVAKNLENISGVVVANGYGFADALSIAPVAAQKGMPILLTNRGDLSKVAKEFLDTKTLTESYVVGGTGVVSSKISSQLNNNTRLGGENRYETNSAVLNHFADKFSYDKVYVASGENYPDALSGSVLAAVSKSPLILVGDSVNSSVMTSVKAQHDKYNNVIVLGGTEVVSDVSANSIVHGIKYLNDREALTLINNADKLGYPVVEANRMPEIYIEGKAYQRFQDEFNSPEKLYAYLNKYYTRSAINEMMSMLKVREIDGAYCKAMGQLGNYSPDILNAKIKSKSISNNKIDLVISTRHSQDGYTTNYKAELLYENGKWRVNYWEGLMKR